MKQSVLYMIQKNITHYIFTHQIKRYFLLSASLIFFIMLADCKMQNTSSSDDLEILQKIVKIKGLQHARWEIFSTPEYKGGIPGPTDYVSLVIEVEKSSLDDISPSTQDQLVWIAPEVVRPWMKEQSKEFLDKVKNKSVDISLLKNCRSISARHMKKNINVDGLECRNSSIHLMYFVLEDHTS